MPIRWKQRFIKKQKKGIMYFGPGVHAPLDLPNNLIRVLAILPYIWLRVQCLKAKLLVDGVENVRIIGRGILAHPVRGIEVTNAKECTH